MAAGRIVDQPMPLREPAPHVAAAIARSRSARMISHVLKAPSIAVSAMPTMMRRKPCTPPFPGEEVDEEGGEHAADDGTGGRGDEARAEDDDRDDAAGVGAGREADDVGAAERIAGERLEDGPGDAESRTEDDAREDPRGPPLPTTVLTMRLSATPKSPSTTSAGGEGELAEEEPGEPADESQEGDDGGGDDDADVDARRRRAPSGARSRSSPRGRPRRRGRVQWSCLRTSQAARLLPADQGDEHGSSDEGGDDTDLRLPGFMTTRPMMSEPSRRIGERMSE